MPNGSRLPDAPPHLILLLQFLSPQPEQNLEIQLYYTAFSQTVLHSALYLFYRDSELWT